jgi:hypothetical protein
MLDSSRLIPRRSPTSVAVVTHFVTQPFANINKGLVKILI